LLPLVYSQAQDPSRLDSNLLKYIDQKHKETQRLIDAKIDQRIQFFQDETSQYVDAQKKLILDEVKNSAKYIIIRVGIIWFFSTLSALLLYRFIVVKSKSKKVSQGFRVEDLEGYPSVSRWR
jgi:hypothetical protein